MCINMKKISVIWSKVCMMGNVMVGDSGMGKVFVFGMIVVGMKAIGRMTSVMV